MTTGSNIEDQIRRWTLETFHAEGAVQEQGFKAVRAGGATVLSHQVGVYRRLDDALRAIPDSSGARPACEAGCSYCCHYHVYVTAPEALAIAEHMRGLPTAERESTLVRLVANAEQAAALGKDRHVQTNIRCAFLGGDNLCSIYAVRPLACRRHHSYDVTPCRTTFEDPAAQDQCPQSPQRIATADGFRAAGSAVARHVGLDFARYELSGAVLEAATNPAAAKRWRDGKTAFPAVKDRDATGGLSG